MDTAQAQPVQVRPSKRKRGCCPGNLVVLPEKTRQVVRFADNMTYNRTRLAIERESKQNGASRSGECRQDYIFGMSRLAENLSPLRAAPRMHEGLH